MEMSKILKDWQSLLKHIKPLTEKELLQLMREEHKDRKRRAFIIRIHQRICVERANREKAMLMAGKLPKEFAK